MRLIFILLALSTLASCANRIYGVPEEQWATLSSSEREQTIAHHQEMEVLREQRRIEEAKVAAEQEKQYLLEMEARQDHVDQIYAQEPNIQGDLLRVTIRSGELYIHGQHRQYRPVSFRIADGEQKIITFQHSQKRHYQIDVPVEYYNGVLSFDYEQGNRYDYRYDLAYEPTWRHGKYYQNITLHKHSHSQARNIEIIIETASQHHRYD
ncbi:MAG: hypothetical protein GQ547_00710 [Methylophaga sp.]|nr:hypothetical protein [Methylophaga sp.]